MRRLLIAVGVLVVLLIVVDRVSPVVAGGVIAKRVRTEASLPSDPDVTFHGFPFLTQAVAGRYDDVEVRARGVRVGRLRDVALDVRLRGLHAPLGDVVGGNIDEVPVDRVTATARIDYARLVAAGDVGDNVTIQSVRGDGDGLWVRASAVVAGQTITATASAAVGVRGDSLVVTARSVNLEDAPAGVPALPGLSGALTFRVPMTGLPFQLRITDVHPGDRGLSVSAEARDIVLGRNGVGSAN